MYQQRATFNQDREAVIQKFARLLEKMTQCSQEFRKQGRRHLADSIFRGAGQRLEPAGAHGW